MLVGFVHGVMNTDNMTISGETIDYGPCAFMEAFDPATVYSSIDHGGRYAYGNQPLVAEWNLARLAEALLPLLDDDQEQAVALAVEALGGFRPQYDAAWSAGMRAKLGLPDGVDDAVVSPLVDDLLALLQRRPRRPHVVLPRPRRGRPRRRRARRAACSSTSRRSTPGWRAGAPSARTPTRWTGSTRVYIPRNHLVEEALAAATDGDLDPLERLLDAVTAPYDERPGLERYAAPAPEDFGAYRTFCGT